MDEDNLAGLAQEITLALRAQMMGRDPNEMVGKMRELPPDLILKYFSSTFFVDLNDEQIEVKISEDVPSSIASLAQSWAIITAYNPYSAALTEEENETEQRNLVNLLTRHGYKLFSAVGCSDDGKWREPSIFVLGISYDLAKAFGSCFRQNAIVFAEASGPIELVMCDK